MLYCLMILIITEPSSCVSSLTILYSVRFLSKVALYRRISSPLTCEGPSAYEMDPINEAVEVAVRDYLNRISIIPREDLIALAGIREVKVAEVNYKQAVSEFNDAQRQVDALEAEALGANLSPLF